MKMKWTVPFLCLPALAAAAFVRGDGSAPAPAAEKKEEKKAEKAETLETVKIQFELKNFNYYDLTKETCPEKVAKDVVKVQKLSDDSADVKVEKADVKKTASTDEADESPPPAPKAPEPPAPKSAPKEDPHVTAGIREVHAQSDDIQQEVQNTFGSGDGSKSGLPWMQKNQNGGAASFLQIASSQQAKLALCLKRQNLAETTNTECTTVMDVLRDAIKTTVKDIIQCLYLDTLPDLQNVKSIAGPGPSPAPEAPAEAPDGVAAKAPAAPAKSVFLHVQAPAPTPSNAPAPSPVVPTIPDVQLYVTFSPGRKIGNGKSTMVEVTFLDAVGNGHKDVEMITPFLVWCASHGVFVDSLGNALYQVTGLFPKIYKLRTTMQTIEQWNIKKCEKHLTSIVNDFTQYYTRRQVPMALYNECTNFMTKMSFSHDYVLDRMDTKRCRSATKKFADHWNKAEHKAEDADFAEMCFNACEAKYGQEAPMCRLSDFPMTSEVPELP